MTSKRMHVVGLTEWINGTILNDKQLITTATQYKHRQLLQMNVHWLKHHTYCNVAKITKVKRQPKMDKLKPT